MRRQSVGLVRQIANGLNGIDNLASPTGGLAARFAPIALMWNFRFLRHQRSECAPAFPKGWCIESVSSL